MTAVLYRVRIPEDAPTSQRGGYITRNNDGQLLYTPAPPRPMHLGNAEILRRQAAIWGNKQGIYPVLEEAI